MPETALKIDVGSLAWAGDRRHVADLTEQERTLLEGISRHLEDALPVDDDTGDVVIEPDEDAEGLRDEIIDLEAQIAALETAVTLAERNLGVQLIPTSDDDPEIDVARVVAERLKMERAEGEKDATIPSRASTAQRKAMRLLIEGRVDVRRREVGGPFAGLIHAKVRGDSGDVYDCGFDPRVAGGGKWRCTCEEMRGGCSHLAAVKMIATT